MMKFFRKYNKQLLAVFMVLLMIVFLGGSALESLMAPRADRVIAHARFGDIRLSDQAQARRSTSILSWLGFNWQQPFGAIGPPLTGLDWILLTREAEHYGTDADLAAARRQLDTLMGAGTVDRLSRRQRVQPERIYAAVVELESVLQTASLVSGAAMPSAAEIRAAACDALNKVKVKAVVFPAAAFEDPSAEFTEEELAAQLERYRDREPGSGLSFGYYVEPKIKAQFFQIKRDKIAETIGIPNLERKAKAYYQEHKNDPEFERPGWQPPEPTDEQTEDSENREPPYLEWDEAKETAVRIVRKQHANEAALNIANWIVDFSSEPWLEIDRGEDGYKTAPPNVARTAYYDEILEHIPSTISYPGSINTIQTDFFDETDANTVPLLGSALARDAQGNRLGNLRSLSFNTKAIVPEVPVKEGANPLDYVATWQTCSLPLHNPETDDVYVFRVAQAQPGHPAESVDEVRDRLITDLRLYRAYQAADDSATALKQACCDTDLETAFDADEDLLARIEASDDRSFGLAEPPPFPRLQPYQAARGRSGDTAYIFQLGKVPHEAIDECFALEEAEDKHALFDIEETATLIVVEWVETQRGREDEFERMKEDLVRQLTTNRRREAARDWFDPEQIRARAGFRWAGADG